MLNNFVLVGKLTGYQIDEDGNYKYTVKSSNDLGDLTLFVKSMIHERDEISKILIEGSVIGFKGFISINKNGENELIATKVTFLSHESKEE